MEDESTPGSAKFRGSHQGSLPASPLGATPRPPLRQKYSKSRYTSRVSEYDLSYTSDDRLTESARTRARHVSEGSSTKSFLILGLIFLASLLALGVVYLNFPKLDQDEVQYIKLPKDIDDAKNLGRVLSRYKDKYFYQVITGVFVMYIFLQTFAIPGSIFLSIICGYLFSYVLALIGVCTASAVGASFCYLLSYLVGRRLVQKYIPDRVAQWRSHVEKNREHLLNYIIFLRITPFLPNWFINITSPVIDVPLSPFFWGTFIGVAPPSFVAVQAGTTLYKLTSSGDAISWTSVIVLAVLALLSLLPVLFKKKLQKKFD